MNERAFHGYTEDMAFSLPIILRDDDILAVNKPTGILSLPDRYDPSAPVATNLLRRSEGGLLVVHRLDKDSSGVLLFAKNAEAHRALSQSFETREAKKIYHALVRGSPSWSETDCDLPLRPDGDKQHRTIIDGGHGKPSRTSFRVLASFGPYALVEARPETGRTHQIRVHLAALGFPIACDPLYGDGQGLFLSKIKRGWRGDPYEERPLIARTALHAYSLDIPHPRSGENLHLEAPYPKDLKAAVAQLEKR